MRRPEKEEKLRAYHNVRLLPLDVTDSAQIVDTCQKALTAFDVDVLMNNAGWGIMAPLERAALPGIRSLFDTQVTGSLLVTQQCIPHFKKRKGVPSW